MLKGYKHTLEAREKMSKARIGKKWSEDVIEKFRKAKLGKKQIRSEAGKLSFKQKMSGKSSHSWKGGLITKNCEVCKKQFKVYPYRKDARFCSPECSKITAFGGKMKGKTHWNWKGGVTPLHIAIRESIEYEEWRKAVLERDSYICQLCGRAGGQMDADHIKRFADYPELRLELSNGQTLCRNCHLIKTAGERRGLHYKLKENYSVESLN